MTAPAKQQSCTYGDYLEWDDEGRYEIINGEVYDMTPAPSRRHQDILMELSRQISNHLRHQTACRVYAAPFDVRFPVADEADEAVTTVVQPDISVICDPSKLDERGCRGAPDWVIEIVSPSTAFKDLTKKLELYQKHGVQEYWIVHPVDKVVTVYVPGEQENYNWPTVYNAEHKVEPQTLEGLVIDLAEVFRE